MEYYYFITSEFKNEINKEVIINTFPNLNKEHNELLLKYILRIIDFIFIKFGISDSNKILFERKLKSNNYRDIRGLLLLLLPYINESGDKTKITSLNDIYIQKKNPNCDLNKELPKYIYSNIQYNRCSVNPIEEIQFSDKHLYDNYYLLLDTIQTVSNKLYVNWLDIRPIDLDTYESTVIYKETLGRIANSTLPDIDFSNIQYIDYLYRGLYIGDIYNCLYNDYYHDIKNIKWLIYDINVDGYIYPLVFIIDIIFKATTDAYKNKEWTELDENTQETFKKIWNKMIELKNASELYDSLTDKNLYYIIKVFVYFFNKYYSKKDEAINRGYINIDISSITYEDSDKIILDNSGWVKSLKTINVIDMYEYLRETYQKFKQTIYFKELINLDEETIKYNRYHPISSIKFGNTTNKITIITYKNLYNFAKSLTHYEYKNKYIPFERHWVSLNSEEKNAIKNRLNSYKTIINSDEPIGWFNIGRYLKNTYDLTDNEVMEYNKHMCVSIIKLIPKMICKSLIYKGVLSSFEFNYQLTENINNKDFIKKYLKNNVFRGPNRTKYNNSYYFLTNEKYNKLKIKYLGKDNIIHTDEYLDYLNDESPGMWFNTYAMDWISQIGFFHKYINNRVIYITGGTGVGKSSQIPKLVLYALKMIDYNNNGKIICSQPRIPPTRGVANTISEQMGVPIREIDDIYEKKYKPTENYNIQYQHKQDRQGQISTHISNKQNYYLRIVTDGLLLQELKTNPILKTKYNNNYTDTNKYDIIMVDEAHEHNKNMDLILSIIKYGLYYNNSLKLIILTATIDEDEPIYRRYYREINDNRKYPFNYLLKLKNIDRLNVDRRLHISPPLEQTRLKIDDFYYPNKNPEELVLEIISKTPFSKDDILLFKTGKKEIEDSVEILNKMLPMNVIALPYYSELDKDKREKIENLNDIIKYDITTPKYISFSENIEYEPVPKGTYNRVVIVATNIAEASITITSLKYVIDTGEQKKAYYNYLTRNSDIILNKISESSRIQRRGRVGRVSSGTVYYLYEKGTMENNKTIYDISISELTDIFFDLIKISPTDEKLFNKYNDPNENIITDDLMNTYKNGLDNMIKKQYFCNDRFIDYIGSKNKVNEIYDYYTTGFSKITLDDEEGIFYIIHPLELEIKRNIIGKIINKPNNLKLLVFWKILNERVFTITNNNNELIKTDYGRIITELKNILDIEDIKFVISYFHSFKYNTNNEILGLIVLLNIINGSINNLAYNVYKNKRYISYIVKLESLYKSEGDIISLIKIVKYLITNINKLEDEEWVINNGFNINTINRFKRNYIYYNSKNININTDIIEKIPTKTDNDNYIIPLMEGFSTNIGYNINKNKYINIKTPTNETIYNLKTIGKYKIRDYINTNIYSSYILYLYQRDDEINITNPIDINYIKYLPLVYNPSSIKFNEQIKTNNINEYLITINKHIINIFDFNMYNRYIKYSSEKEIKEFIENNKNYEHKLIRY